MQITGFFKWATLVVAALYWAIPATSSAAGSTVFYVVAHEDDWQLFMNPNAYYDAQQGSDVKVVLIYTTAGDAGCGITPGCLVNRPTALYYLARENGALRAARFIGTPPNAHIATTKKSSVTVNARKVTRYQYNNVVSYFLRLPDGQLGPLHDGSVPSLTPVTGVGGTYTWSDLVATLNAIVRKEATGSPNVWVNRPETDEIGNPGDHSDHVNTGRAIDAASTSFPCINQAKFVGYDTSNRPANLTSHDTSVEGAVYGATVSGLIDGYAANTFEPGHTVWLGQQYYAIEFGSGSCSF